MLFLINFIASFAIFSSNPSAITLSNPNTDIIILLKPIVGVNNCTEVDLFNLIVFSLFDNMPGVTTVTESSSTLISVGKK